MVTKAPNDDTRGRPAPDSGRNDPAIDPQGRDSKRPEDGSRGSSRTAEGNAYSPDFEPRRDKAPAKGRDADIDTDGG